MKIKKLKLVAKFECGLSTRITRWWKMRIFAFPTHYTRFESLKRYVTIRHFIIDIWTADRGTEISAGIEDRNLNLIFASNDTKLKLPFPFQFQTKFASLAWMNVSVCRKALILTMFLTLNQYKNVNIWFVNWIRFEIVGG